MAHPIDKILYNEEDPKPGNTYHRFLTNTRVYTTKGRGLTCYDLYIVYL